MSWTVRWAERWGCSSCSHQRWRRADTEPPAPTQSRRTQCGTSGRMDPIASGDTLHHSEVGEDNSKSKIFFSKKGKAEWCCGIYWLCLWAMWLSGSTERPETFCIAGQRPETQICGKKTKTFNVSYVATLYCKTNLSFRFYFFKNNMQTTFANSWMLLRSPQYVTCFQAMWHSSLPINTRNKTGWENLHVVKVNEFPQSTLINLTLR